MEFALNQVLVSYNRTLIGDWHANNHHNYEIVLVITKPLLETTLVETASVETTLDSGNHLIWNHGPSQFSNHIH